MPLPKQYAWLENVGQLPRNIQEALKLYGVAEIVGKGSNATILSWRDELNQNGAKVAGYSDDDIAWCGLFAAIVSFRRVGKASEVVENPLWARNWLNYGVKVNTPALGDVLVFSRGSGGHVGFYVAEDKTCFHVLGGNQSNRVCITRVEKDRLLGARRPPYQIQPESVRPFVVNTTGTVSKNEA